MRVPEPGATLVRCCAVQGGPDAVRLRLPRVPVSGAPSRWALGGACARLARAPACGCHGLGSNVGGGRVPVDAHGERRGMRVRMVMRRC